LILLCDHSGGLKNKCKLLTPCCSWKTSLGCPCEIASNRDEALRLLQDPADRIAVIFTDLRMASDSDGAAANATP
jgi:hypothetical protein